MDRTQPDLYEPYLHLHLLGAARALAHTEQLDPLVGPPRARQLLALFIATPVPTLTTSAGAVLLVLLGTNLQSLLLKEVQAVVEAGWGGAAVALLAAEPAVRMALLPLLAHDEDRVRQTAAQALAPAVADPRVATALLARRTDPSWVVRWRVVSALTTQPVAATDALVAACADCHPLVRAAAVRGLAADLPGGDRQGILLTLLRDGEARVRRAVVRALASAVPAPAVVAALLASLRDPDSSVATAAGLALGPVAGDAAVLATLRALLDSPLLATRVGAATALGAGLEDAGVRQAWLPLMVRADLVLLAAACRGVRARVGEPAVRAAALPLLTYPDPLVRRCLIGALTQAAGEVSVQWALVPLLADPDAGVRAATARALGGQWSTPAVRQALQRLLRDDVAAVRAAAVTAWAPLLGTYAGRPDLRRLLADPDAPVRRATLVALAAATPWRGPRVGWHPLTWSGVAGGVPGVGGEEPAASADPPVRVALIAGLTAEDAENRAAAARALGPSAGEAVVREALVARLGDGHATVRRAAARALAYARPERGLIAAVGALLADWATAAVAFDTLLTWTELAPRGEGM